MFRLIGPGPQPTWKKPVYLITTTVLWMMLSVLLQIGLLTIDQTPTADFSWLTWWRVALVIGFGVIGFFIGQMWWRWIYVERRWSGGTTTPHA